MKATCVILAASLATILPAVPAVAKQRAITFTPGSFLPDSEAMNGGHSIVLPEGANASVNMSIILPPDYKTDSTIKLRVTAATSDACNVRLRVVGFTRIRNGEALYPNLAGITAIGGNVATATGNAQVFGKTYEIRGLTTGAVQGQKPGDILNVAIGRESMHAEDTCTGPVYVFGAIARYTYNP